MWNSCFAGDNSLNDYIAFTPENPVSFNNKWSLTTMKKMLLTLCLVIMSASSFAIVNFSTSIGALVMRDVMGTIPPSMTA